MTDRPWTPEALQHLASAYWGACALHAAVRAGVTEALAQGPATAEELARQAGLDARATEMLLVALLALGVVTRQDDSFALAQGLAPLLDPASPQTRVNIIQHHAAMVPDWAQLAGCVQRGGPVQARADDGGQGRRHFYLGMRDLASQRAPGLARRLGLRADMHLLDLGGGPGVYGYVFADETPGLTVTVFDQPQAERYFSAQAAEHPGAERVRFVPGDFNRDDLGGPYDVAWLSHILHGEGPETARALVAKAAEALRPGGALWIQDFILDRRNPRPPWPALFSLNMLIHTDRGQSYSAEELIEMLQAAGLSECRAVGGEPEGSPLGLVTGRKP